ncbi:MAG: TolC family protein [Acidobacteria bacterium]|nr:TolC family protein [Acidobacteriota bacterium]
MTTIPARLGAALLLLLVAAAPAAAQPTLTLERAIEIALANNPGIGVADAAVEVAAAGVQEAAAQRWPRAQVEETFFRTTNPVFVFGNLLGQEAFGPQHFDPAFLNQPPELNNWNSRLSVTQPLWTGGRIARGLAAARQAGVAAEADRERSRERVIHDVIGAYTGAVLAASQLDVAREALETARAHTKLVSDLRQAELVVQSDVLQAQVRESEMDETVIRAESGLAIARAALNAALGRDLDEPYELPRDVAVELPAEPDLERLTGQALQQRSDLRAAGARERAAAEMVRVARGSYLPEVGASGMYEANAEDFIGADGSNWSVAVAARWTLFDASATRARVRRAVAEERQAERMRSGLELQAGLEVRQAYHELRAARERVARAHRAAELAREGLRIVEDRYREGLTTLVELLAAQTALSESRMREVAARRDVLLADAALKLAVGSLTADMAGAGR